MAMREKTIKLTPKQIKDWNYLTPKMVRRFLDNLGSFSTNRENKEWNIRKIKEYLKYPDMIPIELFRSLELILRILTTR